MVVYGIVALIMGIADIVLYVRVERYTGFGPMVSLVSGILSVMAAMMLLVYPNAGKWVLSMLFLSLIHISFLEETAPRIEAMGITLDFNDGGWLAIKSAFDEAEKLAAVRISILEMCIRDRCIRYEGGRK